MKKNTILYTASFFIIVVTLLLTGKNNPTIAQDDSLKVPFPAQELKPLTIVERIDDLFPNGCVSCHIDTGKENEDHRLITVMAQLPKHPKITIIKNVPDDCKKCHGENKKIGKLSLVIHKVHYDKKDENGFMKNFGGKCIYCHSIDSVDWKMKVKSGERNW